MRRAAALIESTLIISLPENVTAVVAAFLRSTGAPSTCQLAASVEVPTGTERLGHSTTKTTLDTYSHVFAASEAKAMQAIDMALFHKAE